MSDKKVGVFGIFSTRVAVENATDSLVKAGFPTSDISVLLPESLGGPKDMGTVRVYESAGRRSGRSDSGWRDWWNSGSVGGHWSSSYSWSRAIHRRRTNHGRFGRVGRRRSSRRIHGCRDRHGNSRIRSQAIRRSSTEGRNSSFCTLRHGRAN